MFCFFFFFQAEDGIRDVAVTGVQTCALPIYHVGGQDARRGGDHEDVQAREEFRPPSTPRIAVEGVREAPGARESRGLLADQVTGSDHRWGRWSAAAIMRGRSADASPSIVTCLAVSLTLPQEIPSRTRAPLKLPSHSGAVVM